MVYEYNVTLRIIRIGWRYAYTIIVSINFEFNRRRTSKQYVTSKHNRRDNKTDTAFRAVAG